MNIATTVSSAIGRVLARAAPCVGTKSTVSRSLRCPPTSAILSPRVTLTWPMMNWMSPLRPIVSSAITLWNRTGRSRPFAKAAVMMTSDRQLPERARERLRRIARHGRVVLELEQPGRGEGVDEPLPRASRAQERGDVDAEVVPHLGAQREHVVGADALGGRLEQPIVEQARGRGRGGALAHAASVRQRRATAHPFIRRLLARLPRSRVRSLRERESVCRHSSAPAAPGARVADAECRLDPAAGRISGAPRRRRSRPPAGEGLERRSDDADDAPFGKDRGAQAYDRTRSPVRSSRARPTRSGRSRARRRGWPAFEEGACAHPWRRCSGSTKRSSSHRPGRPKKRREIMKKQGKGGGLAIFARKQDLGGGRGPNSARSRSALLLQRTNVRASRTPRAHESSRGSHRRRQVVPGGFRTRTARAWDSFRALALLRGRCCPEGRTSTARAGRSEAEASPRIMTSPSVGRPYIAHVAVRQPRTRPVRPERHRFANPVDVVQCTSFRFAFLQQLAVSTL